MKFLLISSTLLLPNLSHATTIIKPIESDRSFVLVKKDKLTVNSNSKDVYYLNKTVYSHCKYNLNDYRALKNKAIGCAVNNNRKRSSDNGDICN
ncbi:hypothetical protein [Yersinia bercovieri]|uniref:hypothetical protein n=1 Tax=Yersinia bercovieri TaxID=634 RepID=UPI000906EC2D|nr:hypothetical protein [Yersinia bercovieri]QKJ06006.1 hypothetical protein HRK25_03165 [Yersinia bercovieri ATCC 43970]